MPWARLDDGFPENDKVENLTDRSFRLHVTAICYCARNLTDGFVSPKALKVCALIAGNGRPGRNVQELIDSGLWEEFEDGWLINDYLEYNPTAEDVKEERRKNRERQALYKARKKAENDALGNGDGNALPNGLGNGAPSRPVVTKEHEPKAGIGKEGWEHLALTVGQVDEVLALTSAERREAARRLNSRVAGLRKPEGYFLTVVRTIARTREAVEESAGERGLRLEQYVRVAGFHYPDSDLEAELRERGADELTVKRLLLVAQEARAA